MQKIGEKIRDLRKAQKITQEELAVQLGISAQAISKWERAEGLPDAYVLHKIAEIFGVSVDFLINEHSEQEKKVETKPARNLKKLIAGIVLWGIIAVAICLIVVLYLTTNKIWWQIFIYALPVTFIVQIVLSCVWWRGKGSFFYASLLNWSIFLIIYVALLKFNFWEIFLIGIPVQIVLFLCYKIMITITVTQKNPKYFVWDMGTNPNEPKKKKNDKTDSESKENN